MIRPNSERPGNNCASSACPPSCAAPSHRTTLWPPFGGYASGLHSAGAAARHQDFAPGGGSRVIAQGKFPATEWVLDTGDRHSHMVVADTGLVTTNAGPYIIQPARARLVGHIGVGDHGPGHTTHVGLAGGQYPLRQLWAD